MRLDLAEVKERHRRRVDDYARWKSDVWPEEYTDIDHLIAEVEALREEEAARERDASTTTHAALEAHRAVTRLEEENRALRERISVLEAESAWFRGNGSPG